MMAARLAAPAAAAAPGGVLTRRRGLALAILSTILFLTFVDNTIVGVALADMQTSLGLGVQALQWVVDGYMLAFAALMLTGGTLGDILGRKKVMLSGVALFVAGSVVALLAQSAGALVAGRLIMGVGAAASEPGTLSLLRQLYGEPRLRARALGVWAAVSGLALAFGPIIGGILVGLGGWRHIFTFTMAFGILAFLAGWRWLPESADPAGRQLDLLSLGLGALALTAVTAGIITGESRGYRTWWVIGLLVVSVLAAVGFWRAERRQPDPVLPLELFRRRVFRGANLLAFATNFGVFAIFFFTALYLEIIGGFSGYKIAWSFLAMAAAMMVAAIATGRWLGRGSSAVPAVAGCLLAGAGMFVVRAVLSPHVGAALLAASLALAGAGFGMTLVTMTTAVLAAVPASRSGLAASVVNTSRELGGVFGVAVLGAVVNGQLTASLAHRLQALGLPTDFQSLVIYAITHGGRTPTNAHVSAGAILAHPDLVAKVTQAAYQAFGRGVTMALYAAGLLLLVTAYVSWRTLRRSP